MSRRSSVGTLWQIGLGIILAGCAAGTPTRIATLTPISTASSAPTPILTPPIQNIWEVEPFARLESGTYFIDPDLDPSTPVRVVYEVPFEGWSMWIGAVKFVDGGTTCSSSGCRGHPSHVGVSITTVTNLVRHGCRDHSWADPPVGPTVEDLATALAGLAPFRVTSRPKDVTMYGYSGKHLELTVPDLPVEGEDVDLRFTRCVSGNLKSWVAAIDTEPGDAYYGYTGPGYQEEFWILDVEGTRLVIVAERSPGSPSEDITELRTILDSIQIDP